MKKTRLGFLFCLFFAAGGCAYDKADVVYPKPFGDACDTTVVRLSVELNTIMEANCFRCHSSAQAPINGGGYNLQDYNTIHESALDGDLLSAIEHDGNVLPMPADGGKLSDCEINQFRAWINKGAPND